MYKCIVLALICLVGSFSADAQRLLRGSVTGPTGEPLGAVTVLIASTRAHTVTDDRGWFEVRVSAGIVKLLVSYTGFTARNLLVNTDTLTGPVQIRLEAAGPLGEVRVSGIKKKSATATRTLMQIQDIPQAIVVIGQRVIQEQGAFDMTTIARNISGLNYTGSYGGGGSYEFFNARGFDLSNSQNYRWNGQMIWNLGNNYADNIEQVEFLKGPTSILFGDVSPGGVLNFVSKQPLHEFYAKAELKAGQWGLFRPTVDVSGPLNNSKTLRYRLNSSYEQSNSFRDYVKEKRFLLAPTIAWDISPRVSVTAEAVIRSSASTDDAGLVSPDGTVRGLDRLSPHLYLGEPGRRYLFSDQSYFLTANWNLTQGWRVRAVAFYGNTRNRPFGIWPGQPDEQGNLERSQYGYRQWLHNSSGSLDLTGSFYTGPVKHNVVLGIDAQSTHYRYTADGSLSFFDSIDLFHPVHGVTPDAYPPSGYLPFVSLLERTGFYGQDQLMFFGEKLHLLLGLRGGMTRQGNHYYQDQLAGTGYEGYTDDVVKKTVWTPRIGIVYKPVTDLSVYGSWSKGYEINSPDIFAVNYRDFINPPPTLSTQLELGAKASLLRNALSASLTVFRIDKKNPYGYTYLPDSLGNISYDKYNVYYQGHHRSEGVELDIDGRLSKEFSATAGAAYTHTEIVSDPGYPKGNELLNAPRWSGNAWLNYKSSGKLKGLTLGAGVFYKDRFYSSLDNDPSLVIPSNYTIDVSAGYQAKRWGIQLNISNLTNRVSYLNPWAFVIYDVQPLRRAVFTLTYRFGKNPSGI